MYIAVPYENGEIFQHFGHTAQFKIYEVKDQKIVSEHIIGAMGSGHGALSAMLKSINTSVVICGGIGEGAKSALRNLDIELFGGVKGNADSAVKAYIDGTLEYNENTACSHHDHDHEHNCEHDCSHHHE